MKIEEAIAHAKEQTEIFAGKHRVFLYLAIEALEEIQAYRAIGTVEELHKKMEELERWHTDKINENIKNPFAYTSTYICHNCDHKDEYIEELESEVAEYKSIGTVEEFKALKEKSVAKKPAYSDFDGNEAEEIIPYKAVCPICGHEFEFGTWNDEENHHCVCGQKIDWSE